MIKLLITARDPATAVSFEKLIQDLLASNDFTLRVLCQEPAFEILTPVVPENCLQFIPKDEFKQVLEDDFLRHQFDTFQPDAVLTGISGPDTGIDEAVLHYAFTHGIQSYALQSFWGDMNQASGARPHTAFVLDDEAIELTNKRYPDIHCIPIGSIKHAKFDGFDALACRGSFRPRFVSETQILLGFYGQPLEDQEGYLRTLEKMAEELKKWHRDFKVMYRPHPKEPDHLKCFTFSLLEKAVGKERVFFDPGLELKHSLSVCDLVVSAFSTCGFDALYLNEMAPKAFNASVYLWFDPELIHWWQTYNQIQRNPLLTRELVLHVDKEIELLDVFEFGLDKAVQSEIRDRAHRYLPQPQTGISRIIEALKTDIKGVKNA